MAEVLAPGLWWLHGTRGSNVFLVEAESGERALIDSGFASSANAILDELRGIGGDLSAILLTHGHGDHAGAADAVRAATGARVYAARAECLESDGEMLLETGVARPQLRKRVLALVARRRAAPGLRIDVAFEGEGELLPGIRATPVPGHTPGSVCYMVERLGAAFVGDLVISHEGTLTRSMRMTNHSDSEYLESIRRFAVGAPEIGLPGHGTPVLTGFGAALRELAALPRRRVSFGIMWERATRMLRFGRQISRPRA